jgi:arylsulfatase A-like enzyme
MILWIPGVENGGRVGWAVENIDLVPTLLDYVGVDPAPLGLEGASLRPMLEGTEPVDSLAFTSQGRYRAVADANHHLILDGAERSVTFFDVVADPLEQNDLYPAGPSAIAPLAAALNRWMAATGQLVRFDEDLATAKSREEQLRALGYLE